MAYAEFSVPSYVREYIRQRGYTIDTTMDAYISRWFHWYTGDDSFYDVEYVSDGRRHTRKRYSLHPARRVAREWASMLLNEDTEVSVETPMANEWLDDYLEATGFWPSGQGMVEKAFALGTAAWALWFDVRDDDSDTTIKLRCYDARMVVPLSWDTDGIRECAFVTQTRNHGEKAEQLQMHYVGESGTYVIETVTFVDGKEVYNPSIIKVFDTKCETPTFGIVRPGIENVAVDLSPYGMSVFADAIDSIKAVDLCFDAIFQEVDLTEVMVFMDEAMIDVRDVNGKSVPVPRGSRNRVFRKLFSQSASDMYEVFSPQIRTDAQKVAFDVALAELGDQCGFGQQYFVLDKSGGLKTATEVNADNASLMRNIHKHENVLMVAIQQVVTALLTCARIHCAAPIEEDFGNVSVKFADSIVTDTSADKALMMSEIAAGLIPKWMYAVEFYGMSEQEAKELLQQEAASIGGF